MFMMKNKLIHKTNKYTNTTMSGQTYPIKKEVSPKEVFIVIKV